MGLSRYPGTVLIPDQVSFSGGKARTEISEFFYWAIACCRRALAKRSERKVPIYIPAGKELGALISFTPATYPAGK